jgi:hypothetical protein
MVASSVLPEKIDQIRALALHQQLDDLAEDLQTSTSCTQCCGAGAESRGAVIKLPPGAGAEIMNYGSGNGFGSFLFIEELNNMIEKNDYC